MPLKPYLTTSRLDPESGSAGECTSGSSGVGPQDLGVPILESAPWGIYSYELTCDGELILVGANAAAEQITGADVSGRIGRTIEEAFPPLAETEIPDRYREVARTGIPWSTESVDYSDGAITGAFEVHAFQPSPGHVAAAFIDITDRTRHQAQLALSEERFRRLFEDSLQGLAIVRDGRFVQVNDAFATAVDLGRGDLEGQRVRSLAPPLSDGDVDRVERALSTEPGHRSTLALQYDSDSGRTRWLELRVQSIELGTQRAVLVSLADLTSLRAVEQDLRRHQRRMSTILAHAADMIFLVDRDWEVSWINRAAARHYELATDEPGILFQFFWCGDSIAQIEEALRRLFAEGTPQHVDTYCDDRVYEVFLEPVLHDGRVVECVGIARDLTERHRAEQQRRQLEEQLQQSRKMEAVGQLAGGIAHDFNNLLTGIQCTVDLLRGESGLEELADDMLAEIEMATSRATRLTRQLLAFSQRQVLSPQVVRPERIIHGIERMLCRVLGEHVTIAVHAGDEVGAVHIDPVQLEQIVLNLVLNARDAMPTGGTITVGLQRVCADGRDLIRLTVADDGVGMDARVLAHAFEPFFTTKKDGRGTGLGLSTVYGAVRQSSGTIEVESAPGVGTRFTIDLPRLEPVDEVLEPTATRSAPDARPATVLLVEDETIVRRSVIRILERLGMRVCAASSPEEALQIVESSPFDLLLTDVVMPGMSGPELADRMRVLKPALKVVYMSGYTDTALSRHGLEEQDALFIAKPFTIDELAAMLMTSLG